MREGKGRELRVKPTPPNVEKFRKRQEPERRGTIPSYWNIGIHAVLACAVSVLDAITQESFPGPTPPILIKEKGISSYRSEFTLARSRRNVFLHNSLFLL